MADSDVFATLRRARRIWALSAVHGEAARLAALHDALSLRLAAGDRLVYLGNYLGHGAAVRAAIDELIAFRRRVIATPGMFACDVVFLRGCQEEMWSKLLQLQFATNPAEVLKWTLGQGVGPTIVAYGGNPDEGLGVTRQGAMAITKWTLRLRYAMNQTPGHADFVAGLKRAAVTDDGRLLFVSAGIDPSRPLAAQDDALWWGGPGFAALEAPGAAPYDGFARIVRGYAPGKAAVKIPVKPGAARATTGVVLGPWTATVDAGAGFGGPLIAACFDAAGNAIDVIAA